MPRPHVFLVASSALVAACGGSGPAEVVQKVMVNRSVLTRCLLAPSSLDEVLLGCLSGTVSLGTDSGGKDCSVSFSSDRLQLSTRDFQAAVPYQRNTATGARDTTYVYERSYAPQSGAFNFSVKAVSEGVVYFDFAFVSNAETGSGLARFGFELAPQMPGAPSVAINCAVQI